MVSNDFTIIIISGGKSVTRRSHEHKNRRFRIQQLLYTRRTVGHLVRVASLRCSGSLRGQKILRSRDRCLGKLFQNYAHLL